MTEPQPSGRRVVAGFAAAATTSAIVGWLMVIPGEPAVTAAWLLGFFLLFGLLIAAFHIVVLAAPVYFMLSGRWPLRWWNAGLGGALVAMLPFGLISLGFGQSWGDYALAVLTVGSLGLAGGLAFWLVLSLAPRSGSCR